jgi:hypothetical protein
MRSLSSRVLVVWPASQRRRLKRRSITPLDAAAGPCPGTKALGNLLIGKASRPAQRTTRETPGHRRLLLRWPGAHPVLQPAQDLPVHPSSSRIAPDRTVL